MADKDKTAVLQAELAAAVERHERVLLSLREEQRTLEMRSSALAAELQAELSARSAALAAREAAHEERVRRVSGTVFAARVDLVVGGRAYSVTEDMMTKHPASFFGELFSGRHQDKRTPEGAFFINRDDKLFRHVLRYLRGEPLEEGLSDKKRADLAREADFYMLPELAAAVLPKGGSARASVRPARLRPAQPPANVLDKLTASVSGIDPLQAPLVPRVRDTRTSGVSVSPLSGSASLEGSAKTPLDGSANKPITPRGLRPKAPDAEEPKSHSAPVTVPLPAPVPPGSPRLKLSVQKVPLRDSQRESIDFEEKKAFRVPIERDPLSEDEH